MNAPAIDKVIEQYRITEEPYYRSIGDEVQTFDAAYAVRMPMMLKGPTGCGKTRFVEYMAWKLGKPLITLACNEDMTASDLVGRYFMEHLSYFVGRMTVTSPPGTQSFQEEYVQQRSKQDLAGVCDFFFGFGLARAPRERHRLLGFSVNALPPAPSGDATAGAVEELVTSPHQGKPVRSYSLGVIAERAPNPNSRVFLSDERDALGSRKIVVDIQPSPCDRRSAHKGLRLFALELARSGHGRAQLQEADESQLLFLMGHHMGTTRMADDPARGVADRNGRVHGMSNLYLAGSSLFVTGGFANPTLTIIALALRQAEHIKRVRAGT